MLQIYNTLTRRKDPFKPRHKKRVDIFVCGPTIYDYMHIGHAKTYVQFDVIVKYLRYKGYRAYYLQNVTDIDDKIIKRAQEKNIDPAKLAREFEGYYHDDEKKLGITSVTKYARATDYIKDIIKQTQALLKKGYAYKISDGYYYDITKFKDYGKLSGRTALGAEDAVSRIDESVAKKNKGDFCLWKFSKPDEPSWDTKIGRGRPGWHIEDTAITEKHFGPQYDIHGGARDLIFPHHEAEIAQMQAISDKSPMARFWIHTGFLTVDGKKMSKSLKNFITVDDALKNYDYKTLRFFYLSSHYHSPIDFTDESIKSAQHGLERLNDFIQYTKIHKKDNKELTQKTKQQFITAMDDDFDTVKAIAALFDFINICYKKNIGGKSAYKLLKKINTIFDIFTFKKPRIPQNITILVEQREKLREQKKWSEADQIRKKIQTLGFTVEDTDKGPIVKKLGIKLL
ncbi:cysteine--tRNA ligase [Patescibacteria group bacterium AH-259-L05]|nr:cysteine--tRNA ligase [Patescibacteria group bacterium AH-259-L05]